MATIHFPNAKYLVVFTSKKKYIDDDYLALNNQLEIEVAKIKGYLGMDSVHDDDNNGITVTYWESKESIAEWAKHNLHLTAKYRAQTEWYDHWSSYICEVVHQNCKK